MVPGFPGLEVGQSEGLFLCHSHLLIFLIKEMLLIYSQTSNFQRKTKK